MGIAKKLLPDALWAEIAPLFPADAPRPKGGRPRVENREALIGILFVLYTAPPWERLPFEVGGRMLGHDLLATAARLAGRRPVR